MISVSPLSVNDNFYRVYVRNNSGMKDEICTCYFTTIY